MKINYELDFETIDDQIVVLDNCNNYFGDSKALILNKSATHILLCIKENKSYEETINEYAKLFKLGNDKATVDVDECLNNFITKGIIINDK